VPILITATLPAAASVLAAQIAALDDVFARYPVHTLIHIPSRPAFQVRPSKQRTRHLQ
jgi:hypothetical protein